MKREREGRRIVYPSREKKRKGKKKEKWEECGKVCGRVDECEHALKDFEKNRN